MRECSMSDCYIQRRNLNERSLIVYGGYVGTVSEWAAKLNTLPTALGRLVTSYGLEKTISFLANNR